MLIKICYQAVEIHVACENMNFCISFHSLMYLSLQHNVLIVTSGFEAVQTSMRVEWKSVTITSGELCVMTPGAHLKQVWYTDNLDFHQANWLR